MIHTKYSTPSDKEKADKECDQAQGDNNEVEKVFDATSITGGKAKRWQWAEFFNRKSEVSLFASLSSSAIN